MDHKWLSSGSISFDDSVTPRATEQGSSNAANTGDGTSDIQLEMCNATTDAPKMKKYCKAAKTLLPYRRSSANTSKVFPSSEAGLFSYITMSWFSKLMWKAFRQGLTKEDLWELDDIDKADANSKRLNGLWRAEKELNGENASFPRCAWKFCKTRVYVSLVLMVFTVTFQFLGPAVILKSILTYVEDSSWPIEYGFLLAFLAFSTQVIRNLLFSGMWMINIHTGLRLQGAMQYIIYEKLLKLRNCGGDTLSQAVTMCTNDQERIFECVSGGVLVIAAPAMFVMSVVYSLTVIGPWALVGNFVILLFYPVMGGISASMGITRRNTVPITNKRVCYMTELLNSIKLVKMYAWENYIAGNIYDCRAKEEEKLKLAALLQSLIATITPMISIVASIFTFIGYSSSGNNLTATEAFTIFSLFSSMQFTAGTLPFALRSIAEAKNCFRNFQNYLQLPEYEVSTNDPIDCDHDSVIVIRSGSFAWENPTTGDTKGKETNNRVKKSKKVAEQPEEERLTESVPEVKNCLKNINIDIKRGKLIGISGQVGSGKSSLLSALLGDMIKTNGSVLIRGSLAYVSQQAWIYSGSFQENILFGLPLNKIKYEKVLEICCLKEDLKEFENGDQTLLGDKGVNISGGQKQRINLARAIYADKSIYLLDDALSAVDPAVGNEIFIKCIKKHLGDKTVLFTTHNVSYLKMCKETITMQDGKVSLKITPSEKVFTPPGDLTSTNFGPDEENFHAEDIMEVKRIEKPYLEIVDEHKVAENKRNSKSDQHHISILKEIILKDDELKSTKSGWQVLGLYMTACGGIWYSASLLVFLIFFGVCQIASSLWLQIWLDAGDGQVDQRRENASLYSFNYTADELKGYINENPNLGFYQGVLMSSILITLIVGLIKGYLASRYVLRGATSLHAKMFQSVLHSPMSFFETTPMGRILSRFSKDMDELDARLPFFIEFVGQAILFILLSLSIICVIYPFMTLPLLLVLGIMISLDVWLNVGVREARKLEIMLKSPVVHHILSSNGGLSIIRTFNRQAIFERRFCEHVNKHLSADCIFRVANRWFVFRMDMLGVGAILATIITSVLSRGSVSAASIGLALSTIYSICTFVPFIMRMKSELMARFSSVERVLDYAETLTPEVSAREVTNMPEIWPSQGEVIFNAAHMRYRNNLPIVLKNVSLKINGGEKIGIVGRTGAGKSSLIAALFRLCELEKGCIKIDGVDISHVPLKRLRTELAVIPQDPVLFGGTVRYNLDPFNKYDDSEVWAALEKSYMKDRLVSKDRNLDTMVLQDGENFSVGEKQLLCMARVLLRKNKILLMDEATSAVDSETERLIQEIIQVELKDCTVITIAHRCTAVDYYDRVVFLDRGSVLEFDTVQNLLQNEKSNYRKLMANH